MQLPSILILDEEEAVRDSLRMILQEEGYACFVSGSATESREYIDSGDIDIIIADSQLILRTTLLQEIKDRYPSIKVIVISSYLVYETCYFDLVAWADECILEPIDFDELLALIQKLTATPLS